MSELLVEVKDGIGRIQLNRPRQINALTVPMLRQLTEVLTAFADDDAVQEIELSGAGERGLCAGADVRELRDRVLGGGDVKEFFEVEYRLDLLIANFPKPYRAMMRGITMGGGLGLSAHGSIRVVDATSRLAMPETQIGLFPDVFLTPLLARMPGQIGTHLGLCGASINAADAIELGLADTAAGELPPPDPALRQEWVAECYTGANPALIVQRLEQHRATAARAAAAELRRRSPISIAVSLEALRRAAQVRDLNAHLAAETALAVRLATGPDFAEGVRALLVDRDGDPHWTHSRIEDVSRAEVLSYFEPLP